MTLPYVFQVADSGVRYRIEAISRNKATEKGVPDATHEVWGQVFRAYVTVEILRHRSRRIPGQPKWDLYFPARFRYEGNDGPVEVTGWVSEACYYATMAVA